MEELANRLEAEKDDLNDKLRKAKHEAEKYKELTRELTDKGKELKNKVASLEIQSSTLQYKLDKALSKVEVMDADAQHISSTEPIKRMRTQRSRHLSLISEIKRLEDDDDDQYPRIIVPRIHTPDIEEREDEHEDQGEPLSGLQDEDLFKGSSTWHAPPYHKESSRSESEGNFDLVSPTKTFEICPQHGLFTSITPLLSTRKPLEITRQSNAFVFVPPIFPPKNIGICRQYKTNMNIPTRKGLRKMRVCGQSGVEIAGISRIHAQIYAPKLSICRQIDLFPTVCPANSQTTAVPTLELSPQMHTAITVIPSILIETPPILIVQRQTDLSSSITAGKAAKVAPILTLCGEVSPYIGINPKEGRQHSPLRLSISHASGIGIEGVRPSVVPKPSPQLSIHHQIGVLLLAPARPSDSRLGLYQCSYLVISPTPQSAPTPPPAIPVLTGLVTFTIVEIPCIPINCTACKKKRYAGVSARREPLEEYFLLVRPIQATQAVKLNSPNMNAICTVSPESLYRKAIDAGIPFQNVSCMQWHIWVETQLTSIFLDSLFSEGRLDVKEVVEVAHSHVERRKTVNFQPSPQRV